MFPRSKLPVPLTEEYGRIPKASRKNTPARAKHTRVQKLKIIRKSHGCSLSEKRILAMNILPLPGCSIYLYPHNHKHRHSGLGSIPILTILLVYWVIISLHLNEKFIKLFEGLIQSLYMYITAYIIYIMVITALYIEIIKTGIDTITARYVKNLFRSF